MKLFHITLIILLATSLHTAAMQSSTAQLVPQQSSKLGSVLKVVAAAGAIYAMWRLKPTAQRYYVHCRVYWKQYWEHRRHVADIKKRMPQGVIDALQKDRIDASPENIKSISEPSKGDIYNGYSTIYRNVHEVALHKPANRIYEVGQAMTAGNCDKPNLPYSILTTTALPSGTTYSGNIDQPSQGAPAHSSKLRPLALS